MAKPVSVLIVGVGGQGTLLASRILGCAVMNRGFDVKVGEVHGMSQRGGSVETYVRWGEKVYSPVITKGEADVILAFEALEAARFLPYLKKGGKVIANTQQIDPMPVAAGNASYPEAVLKKVGESCGELVALDALSLAEEAGSQKAVNVVLLGALAKRTDIPEEVWLDAVKSCVPPKFIDMNLKAFALGYSC